MPGRSDYLGAAHTADTLSLMRSLVDVVFLNGTVGSGKTTLAAAIDAAEAGPRAVIDLDEIRRFSPASVEDPFNHELELQNLASLAVNFRRAGAERFVVAGVIEDSREVERYVQALGAKAMRVFRLTAPPEVLSTRLRQRHSDNSVELAWHLNRAGQLTEILDRESIDEVPIDTAGLSPAQLAEFVRRQVGWT